MSTALYGLSGLRFWSENEIEIREAFQSRIASVVRRTLISINPAFRMFRMEGPCLTPAEHIGSEYTHDDVFTTNHIANNSYLSLRAETTKSSYLYARTIGGKLPICVWQSGKSFRRELSDGATASKLRYNEFYQQEFQVIYSRGTLADYRGELIKVVYEEVGRFTKRHARVVDSDRLPSYSLDTKDIEVSYNGVWKEVASCSIRNDYGENEFVAEIAIGLCRIAEISAGGVI